jgi:4'-phosphopantetheinyl transferase EntD
MNDLEEAISSCSRAALGADLIASVSREPISLSSLNAEEQAQLSKFSNPVKKRTWLVGRAALKPLLRRMGFSPDSSQISFPHSRISLSHSGDYAVAIASSDKDVLGLGVDLETATTINPKTVRFFLSPGEIRAIEQGHFQWTNLVQLWTVKEAIFKSDMENEHRLLSDYQIVDWPEKASLGWATRCVSNRTNMKDAGFEKEAALFRFCLSDTPLGFVAIAIRKRRDNHAYEQRSLAS